jgi:alpha-tubulin suppressor-like RCC1 family protein
MMVPRARREPVMSIATGCCYTVVLNQDGRLFCSGNNINGCLSQGTRHTSAAL